MKVQCPHCGVPSHHETLSAFDEGFGFLCPACHAKAILAPQRTPTKPAEPSETADSCPKCDHPKGGASACPRCGLDFELARGRRFNRDPLAGHPQAQTLRELASQLKADLNNHDLHLRFIERCIALNALEFAGLEYRKLVLARPALAPYRERVIQAALAQAGPLERPSYPEQAKRIKAILMGAAVVLLLISVFVALRLLQYRQQW